MRFAHKLSLAVMVLLAVSLALVGYLTVQRNFEVSISNTITQNVEQHLVERYALEAEVLSLRNDRTPVTQSYLREYGEGLTGYVQSSTRWLGIYGPEASSYYSNLPPAVAADIDLATLDTDEQGYHLRQYGDTYVMLVASTISSAEQQLWLLSAYDVSAQFTERTRQMRDMIIMDLIVLTASAVLVSFISGRLTRPMRRLNIVSRKIASGAYEARSDIKTDDEIGELAMNFNRMAEAVETQVLELNASVQQREDFVAAFTHEVKTPMTAIIGYSDILRSQQTEAETRQKAAQFIYRESKRLESLSQKLLVLMGLSTKQAELLPVSLGGLFTDAGRSVIPNLGEYDLALKPAEGVVVLADRDLAVDLIRNLLLNAIKAQPKDGRVTINWYQEPGGDSVRVMVCDTGRGIPPDELARIMEPFYMVDKSRARREGGSGVGLALSQKIAQLHGSELHFDSEEGVGTKVSFTLPLP